MPVVVLPGEIYYFSGITGFFSQASSNTFFAITRSRWGMINRLNALSIFLYSSPHASARATGSKPLVTTSPNVMGSAP